MEVGMSLNALVQLPLSGSRRHADGLIKHSFVSTRSTTAPLRQRQRQLLVVKAKGKKGMASRQFQQRTPQFRLPEIEDDGNPRFIIFIRAANVGIWYPLSIITGGSTAKIMLAAKDNFLGKYIYKDTLARNLAAAVYRDEKEIQKTAIKQHRLLATATGFRYGYKLIENGDLKAALTTGDVIELPTQEGLKTVLDKVKDFFGNTKESFGKISMLNSNDESQEGSKEKAEAKS